MSQTEVALTMEEQGVQAVLSGEITEAVETFLQLPQSPCPVRHFFSPGLYVREAHYKAGLLVIGHPHTGPHLNIMLKGKLILLNQAGGGEVLEAPQMFTAGAGRKSAYILEDVIWQNIWATEETDVEAIEAVVFAKEESFLQAQMKQKAEEDTTAIAAAQEDYLRWLQEIGKTEEEMTAIVHTPDLIPFPPGSYSIKLGESAIHGKGLFVTAPIPAGATICPMRIGVHRTPAGRFINHSDTPNSAMVRSENGDLHLIALYSLRGCQGGFDGEELTLDYRQCLRMNHELKEMLCLDR